jgi:hypothetical protein
MKYCGATVMGRRFDSHAYTRARCIKNRAPCAGYPDDQANFPLFRERYIETGQPCNSGHVCYGLVNVYRTHHQPNASSDKDTQRLKIEGSVSR